MKIKIRQGVFETNSSTMHSIVITKDYRPDYYDKRFCYEHDIHTGEKNKTVICLENSRDFEFGRFPFKMLKSVTEKACYVFSSMFHCEDIIEEELLKNERFIKAKETLLKIIQEKLPQVKDIKFPWDMEYYYLHEDGKLTKYIHKSEYEKESEERWDILVNRATGKKVEIVEKKEYHFGFNDSPLSLEAFLKSHNISYSEFIFNPKYVVIIDGDEYCIFDDMKKILGSENIIEEFGECESQKLMEKHKEEN